MAFQIPAHLQHLLGGKDDFSARLVGGITGVSRVATFSR